MGLDSYLFAINKECVIDDFNFLKEGEEVKYWRRRWDIHNAMKRLFVRKGGDKSNDFNCESVRVTAKDLKFLKDDLDWLDEEVVENSCDSKFDVSFIEEMLSFLKANPRKALYFYSWY